MAWCVWFAREQDWTTGRRKWRRKILQWISGYVSEDNPYGCSYVDVSDIESRLEADNYEVTDGTITDEEIVTSWSSENTDNSEETDMDNDEQRAVTQDQCLG